MRSNRSQIVGSSVRFAVAGVLLLLACAAGGCQGEGKGPLGSLMSKMTEPFQSPKPSDVARDLFDVTDADKRRRAIALFSAAPYGGTETYVKWYRLFLGGDTEDGKPVMTGEPDPDSTVRAAAVDALGVHGTVDDVILIAPRLDDNAAFVRWEAAKALGKIYHPDTIRPLLRKLREDRGLFPDEQSEGRRGDPDADVRQACAVALGQYATPAVFDGLVAALDDSNFRVSYAARESLRKLTGHDMGTLPADWLAWEKKHGDNLFRLQQTYTWQPYEKPRGLLDKMQFWKNPKFVHPRLSTGQNVRGPTPEPDTPSS